MQGIRFSVMSNHMVKKYGRRKETSSFGLAPEPETVAIWSSTHSAKLSVALSSVDMKGMSQLDERKTGKTPSGTSYSMPLVSLGRTDSCFIVFLSHGLLDCKK